MNSLHPIISPPASHWPPASIATSLLSCLLSLCVSAFFLATTPLRHFDHSFFWPAISAAAQTLPVASSQAEGVSNRGPTHHFSALTSSSWCVQEVEEGADKSNSLFHHTGFILHSPLLMRQGSKPGWSLEIYGRQIVQAIKAKGPANEQPLQSRRGEVQHVWRLIDPVSSTGDM